METPEKCENRPATLLKKRLVQVLTSSGVFIVNFEQISHIFLVFLLLTLKMQVPVEFGMSVKLIGKPYRNLHN